jgi:hypothetical protein
MNTRDFIHETKAINKAKVLVCWTVFTLAGWLGISLVWMLPQFLVRMTVGAAAAAGLGIAQGLILRNAGARVSLTSWGMTGSVSAGAALAAGRLGLDPFGQSVLWLVLLSLSQAVLLRKVWFFAGWWILAYWPGFLLSTISGWHTWILCAANSALLMAWLSNLNWEDG